MIEVLPWHDIEKPSADLKRKRVDNNPLGFYWAKDMRGALLLILTLPNRHESLRSYRGVEFSDIKTDIRYVQNTDETYFAISLVNSEKADIFYHLCQDLVSRTEGISDPLAAFSRITARLKDWRALFERNGILSVQEVQGLFAELTFLEECLINGVISVSDAAEAWAGPDKNAHDFIITDTAVEIKSITGSKEEKLNISSEHQLLTHLSRLYIRVYFLAKDNDGNTGVSLNQKVRNIINLIRDVNITDTLNRKLARTGYLDIPAYDRPCFTVQKVQTYHVSEAFPKLTPYNLSSAISNVSYSVSFNHIQEFMTDSIATGSFV